MVRVFRVKDRPLSMAEIITESGFKISEYDMKKRLGPCSGCKCLDFILLPKHSKVVQEGGKRYMVCLDCGQTTHL